MKIIQTNIFADYDVSNICNIQTPIGSYVAFRDNRTYNGKIINLSTNKEYTFINKKVTKISGSFLDNINLSFEVLGGGSEICIINMNDDILYKNLTNYKTETQIFKNSNIISWNDSEHLYIRDGEVTTKLKTGKVSYINGLSGSKNIIVYRDTIVDDYGVKHGKFIIFNKLTDNFQEKIFDTRGIYDFKVVETSENFIILYRDGSNGHYGSFSKLSKSGEVLINGVFNSTVSYDIDVIINNNIIYACFRDGENGNCGTLVALDTNMNEINRLVFDKSSSTLMSLSLNNKNIIIAYRDINGYGKWKEVEFD